MTLPSTLEQTNRITTEMRYKFIINRSKAAHFCSMKISEGVRQYAAAQALSEEEAVEKGMEEKSKEFVEAGSEVYVPS